MNCKKFTRVIVIVIVLLSVLAAGILSAVLITSSNSSKRYQEAVSLGEKYLNEMDYANAIVMFSEAININPKEEEAYISLIRLYTETGEYENANYILEAAKKYVASAELSGIRKELEQMIEKQDSPTVVDNSDLPKKAQYSVRIETLKVESITVQYPVITSSIDSQIINNVNAIYKGFAQEEFESWNQEITDLVSAGEDRSQLVFSLTCEGIYQQDEILSIKYDTYFYTGGAHGYGYSDGMSYNLETGKELTIGNLLNCSEDLAWEAAISVYNRTIVGKLESITEDAVRGVIRGCGYWKTETGVMVQIPPYAVASYAAGPQEALVTVNDVAAAEGQAESQTEQSLETITVINNISAPATDFLFSFSSTRLLTEEDLKELEANTVDQMHSNSQMAINEIMARYGFTFNPEKSDTANQAYIKFNGCNWYLQALSYCPYHDANEMIAHLNDIERENIEIINNWQKAHNCYY